MTKKQISVKQDVNAVCAHFRHAENVAFPDTARVSTSAYEWGAKPVFEPVCYSPDSYVSTATKNTRQEMFFEQAGVIRLHLWYRGARENGRLCFINRQAIRRWRIAFCFEMSTINNK